MGRILIVDDEASVREAFADLLRGLEHMVFTADTAELALDQLRQDIPDVVVTDLNLPGIDGLELFRQIREIRPRLPVIVMTGFGTMENAIQATKLGAFDYQLKPVDPEAMIEAIDRALDSVRIMQRNVDFNPREVQSNRDAIIGTSSKMQEVYKAIGRVAATDATVLIRGESGTGKELVARAVYQHSLRTSSPLLAVNCSTIPESLLESELFGHERGAFTGAAARKIGKFEQAHGGTIFLDEIGDISLSVQARMLRVIQSREYQRVGSNETQRVDVRLLAATNRDLERAMAEGQFREDLFYRLNVVTIMVPPLRERPEDIPLLVDYFVGRYAMELGVERPILADDARELLLATPWPGNVRELEHCIYRVLIFTRGYPIRADDVRLARERTPTRTTATGAADDLLREHIREFLDRSPPGAAYDSMMERVEQLLLTEALDRAGGNQSRAARLLGLSRPSLHARIRKFGLLGPNPR